MTGHDFEHGPYCSRCGIDEASSFGGEPCLGFEPAHLPGQLGLDGLGPENASHELLEAERAAAREDPRGEHDR